MLHKLGPLCSSPNLIVDVTSPSPDATASSPSPTEAWLSLCDDLLWAFNHALSNRLAALTSITRILEHSDTGLDPLLSVLSSETTALEETLGLLRLLPRNPHEVPEPIRLEDLLPNVIALHRLQSDLRDLHYQLENEPDTQPVWVEPSLLTHALLFLLAAASRAARRAGSTAIAIRFGGDEESVRLVIESPPALGEVQAEEGPWKPMDARVVEALLAHAGGELLENRFAGDPHSGVRFELKLPTLLAVRARERAEGRVGE